MELNNEPLNTQKQITLDSAKIQEMLNGMFTNNGFVIVADTELNDGFLYKTSEHATASQRPKLVIQYQVSSATSTPAPTTTATYTPTPTFTATPTQPPAFTSADFVYDGDGRQVKSVINGVTTLFVGSHYQVENGVVVKYYFAGAQRIAMRKNSTLSYILTDHLGSTSMTTNASGALISQLKYKAWGETRYSSGSTPTNYKYTGQREEAGFGLYFYNARWYDSLTGRFAQADTIVPAGVQGLDRYAYVSNNPIKYTDPTGHMQICERGDEGGRCGRGADFAEIYTTFDAKHGGRWDGLFAEYYAKLSIAQRAVEWFEVDPNEENYNLMYVAVQDARNSKRYASNYVPQSDVARATQTYPNIIGGGFIDTEYSLGDDFTGPGMVDPSDPFDLLQETRTPTLTPTLMPTLSPTPTPTLTPIPTRTPIPTEAYETSFKNLSVNEVGNGCAYRYPNPP